MNMVEKVAKAIGQARMSLTGGSAEQIPSDFILARAAIEAMREPTLEMIEAVPGEYDGVVADWMFMIDAALESQEKG